MTTLTLRREQDLPDLLSRPELAQYLGIAVQTLARWASEGHGPKVTKLGSHVRYRREDIAKYLAEQSA